MAPFLLIPHFSYQKKTVLIFAALCSACLLNQLLSNVIFQVCVCVYLDTHTYTQTLLFNLGSEMNLWSLNLLLHLHLFFIYRLQYVGEALSSKWPCAFALSPIDIVSKWLVSVLLKGCVFSWWHFSSFFPTQNCDQFGLTCFPHNVEVCIFNFCCLEF